MKQTAVEWLVQKLAQKGDYGLGFYLENKDEIIQAKEMEKEQMRLADKNGQDRNQYKHDCEYGGVEYWDSEPKPFDEYYNETFNTSDK
jgi:hypothetical protein